MDGARVSSHVTERAEVVIVGAGAAGLALARQLQRRGRSAVVLEAGEVGSTWSHHYDGLRLHTLKQVSALPGLAFGIDVDGFPAARDVRNHLAAYREHFDLDVREHTRVDSARWTDDRWVISTGGTTFEAQAVVAATGIRSTPWTPPIAGLDAFGGTLLHAADYRNPPSTPGRQVVVVGAGNSGCEIAAQLAHAGRDVTLAVRDGVQFVPRPTSALVSRTSAWALRTLPAPVGNMVLRAVRSDHTDLGLPPPATAPVDTYPVVGDELPDAVRAGLVRVRPGVHCVEQDRVVHDDDTETTVDTIVLATGYRPTLGWVDHDDLEVDDDGRPLLDAASRSTRRPTFYALGFDYPNTEGWLQAIGRRADALARIITADLRHSAPLPDETETPT